MSGEWTIDTARRQVRGGRAPGLQSGLTWVTGGLANGRFTFPDMETQIKTSLNALLAAIKSADGQVIADEMTKLDDYLERGRAGLHPQLVHFLENRSYAKAAMFLGGDL